MFNYACAGRSVKNEKNRFEPLTVEEVGYELRGWTSYDTTTKSWGVKYKPYRKYWVRLL